ncbi:MAG: DUF2207 domain-containing protein [Candidatus Electrothrix sp. AX2]|nr:DUF2207 domain-containing protein [Candidatus Electrothrix gigas]
MKCLRQLLAVYVQAIVLAVFLLNTQTASAKSPPFYWEFMNVEIDVQENGDMLVTETQKYVFTGPHSNERYRYIPLDKVDGIDQIEVYEGEEKLPFSTNIKNNQRWIKWRHELNPPESHTFVLKYRIRGGIQIHDEEDWVYVKAIFKERSAPIESGKVTVQLPDALTGKISSFKSFGGSADTRQVDDRTVEFTLQDVLPPGQELEVRVAFPHGVLALAAPVASKSQPKKSSGYWKKKAAEYKKKVKESSSVAPSSSDNGDVFTGACYILIIIIVILIVIFLDGRGGGGSSSGGGYYTGGCSGGGSSSGGGYYTGGCSGSCGGGCSGGGGGGGGGG